MTSIVREFATNEDLAITAVLGTTPEVLMQEYAGGCVQVTAGSVVLLTFYASIDGTTFDPLFDQFDIAVTLTVANNKVTNLPDAVFNCPHIKMVGDVAGTVSLFKKG